MTQEKGLTKEVRQGQGLGFDVMMRGILRGICDEFKEMYLYDFDNFIIGLTPVICWAITLASIEVFHNFVYFIMQIA